MVPLRKKQNRVLSLSQNPIHNQLIAALYFVLKTLKFLHEHVFRNAKDL